MGNLSQFEWFGKLCIRVEVSAVDVVFWIAVPSEMDDLVAEKKKLLSRLQVHQIQMARLIYCLKW